MIPILIQIILLYILKPIHSGNMLGLTEYLSLDLRFFH